MTGRCARCAGRLARVVEEDGVDIVCLACGASALAPSRPPTEAERAEIEVPPGGRRRIPSHGGARL